MPRFLSPDWISALDEAAAARGPLENDADDDAPFVVQQVVVDGGDDGGELRYHLVFGPHRLVVRPGPADHPTVTLTTDLETARGVSRGRQSAQAAFMTGRLRVGGDVQALTRHPQLTAALDDLFATVRTATTY